ncbi:hypothetical protein PAXRUDRAFT_21198 [Paxillus rubicundulus Ve08.2h10]|uniref:Uncharacterized protein n=1 Tax=Paxillus rubicundulus Ve08.2h10 TaxID=930991 RepID=A0A0D0CCB0_9AGAM|nr:hypothetical protein PAXRUDRAFT_21198 [Paxillus rubicundulus Ve08.2h10]
MSNRGNGAELPEAIEPLRDQHPKSFTIPVVRGSHDKVHDAINTVVEEDNDQDQIHDHQMGHPGTSPSNDASSMMDPSEIKPSHTGSIESEMGPSEVQLSQKANALFAHRDFLKDAAKYNNS